MKKAILVTFVAKQGMENELENFLISEGPMIEKEPGCLSWYVFKMPKFGEYGAFLSFSDEKGLQEHFLGIVPKEWTRVGNKFLAQPFVLTELNIFDDSRK